MKKTVIANWGHASQGKSSSIKKVAELIEKLPGARADRKVNYAGDIAVIFQLKNVKIGIASGGDPNGSLEENLKDFVKKDCDIIICCTRTSGATVGAVDALAKRSYRVLWVTNHRSDMLDQDSLNDLSALQMMEIVRLLLNSKL